MNGKEVGLVTQFRDQRQFVFDQLAHVFRCVGFKAPAQSFLGQPAQMSGRRLAIGYEFLRILVAQRIERKRAACRHVQRLGEQFSGIQIRQPQPQPQVALGVGVQRVPAALHWQPKTDRSERVLQPAA